MKNWKLGRPSPALVIALAALFAALGGSAYAATRIDTKDIKNGAITAAKIKKEAVGAAKIKNGAISGAKLDLAQLGTVPSAAHAASADTAGKADVATKAGEADRANEAKTAQTATLATTATNFSRYFSTGIVRASVGQEVTIWQAGPFTATGHCADAGKGTNEAWTTVTTSAPHSTLSAYGSHYCQADFEPGVEAELGYTVESIQRETDAFYSHNVDFFAFSPDGGVRLRGSSINNVNYYGADCAFFAEFTNGG